MPYARLVSGIQIWGDAWTWWNQAVDRFRTGNDPETGSVLVFRPEGRMSRGHVAVVSDILTDRVIRVTHANWGGSRGRVEENVTVVDVSHDGDWTAVKVWYNPINDLGTSVYPTYGFIYKGARDAFGDVLGAAVEAQAATAGLARAAVHVHARLQPEASAQASSSRLVGSSTAEALASPAVWSARGQGAGLDCGLSIIGCQTHLFRAGSSGSIRHS